MLEKMKKIWEVLWEEVLRLRDNQGGFIAPEGEGEGEGSGEGEGGEGNGDTGEGEGEGAGGEGEPAEEEINGVKYTKDEEGNYCLGNVKILDSGKVPFFNRSKEFERKSMESETQFQRRTAESDRLHREEIARLNTPAPNDDDIEERTGLTYGQLKAMDSRNQQIRAKELQGVESRTLNLVADTQINQQKFQLGQLAKYKTFFANKGYVEELDRYVKGLSLQSALLPNIVEQAVKLVIGEHYDETIKDAEKRGRKSALEHREIVGEIELGKTVGVSGGGTVQITPEIREFAKASGLSLELAADTVTKRQKNKKEIEKRRRENG